MELKTIQSRIYEIRGQRVMIDFDLAELYETETKRLKEAVRRNMDRFPPDFMFELTQDEFECLRTQIASSNRGGIRYTPFAFTEQGVAMLSSVLKSKKAAQVNIAIMRAFVFLRQHLANYQDLKKSIELLEKEMNIKFKDINQALTYLLRKDKVEADQSGRKRIGFK
ncbi:MAG: ORF6N domain-containing protein [Saprospiraceae bacterium]